MSISFDRAIIFLGVSRSGLARRAGAVAWIGDGCGGGGSGSGGGGAALTGVEVVDMEEEDNTRNV